MSSSTSDKNFQAVAQFKLQLQIMNITLIFYRLYIKFMKSTSKLKLKLITG